MKNNLPEEFLKTIPEELAKALETTPPASVRFNPLKPSESKIEKNLEAVAWCEQGRYFDERPLYTTDPLFHAGAYYPQEASSMMVGWIAERVIEQIRTDDQWRPRILDLCAAPGGKTTQLTQYASTLVSNAVIRPRAKILAENVQRWGSGNVIVTSNDPSQFGRYAMSYFDIVVVDTPCSGEGMFRKDHDARSEWSPANVELCTGRSRRIVSDVWNALRDGGVMIYSTCTFNRSENEENALWICNELGGELVTLGSVPEGIVTSDAGYRFFPHLIRGEGFYVVAIRKNGEESRINVQNSAGAKKKNAKSTLTPITKQEQEYLNGWVAAPLQYASVGEIIYGYDQQQQALVEAMKPNFDLLYSGVMMGQTIRGELKPSHSLAMYHDIRFDNRVELTLEQSLEYLRRNPLPAALFAKEGLALVTFDHLPLGWIKKIGNRTNNLYPQQLRILHY